MVDRSALARATEASDAPTPGYLYVDIAKSAAASPVSCQEIATYLTRRLASKNNHNIKYKCLKVIGKVASDPMTRGQFKRVVSQDAQAVATIKECLNFRGPPDPARGDEIYARVRAAAKEALDSVYSDTPTSSDANYSSANASLGGGGHRSIAGGGYGANYGAPPSSSSSNSGLPHGVEPGPPRSSGRMEGIGNPMYKDPRNEVAKGIGNMTLGEAASVVGETVAGIIKDPLARNVPTGPPQQQRPAYGGPAGGGGYGAPTAYSNPPGRSELSHATGGQWNMASNRGPNAIGSSTNTVGSSSSTQNSEYYKARDRQGFQWDSNSGGGTSGASTASGGVGGSWGAATAAAPPSSFAARPAAGAASIASQSRAPPAHSNFAPPTANGGNAVSDGSYERNLIMELCPPGGMKAEPPPDKLSSFARSVPSLNPDLICPALLDLLEDGNPWIIRAKALCVMETTIDVERKSGSGATAYADFFHSCHAEIEPLASHPRAAIKEPARRVLRALGIDPGTTTASSGRAAATPAPPPAPPAADLLDFGGTDTTTTSTAPAPPPAVPSQPATTETSAAASTNSLFGGMQVKSTTTTTADPAPPAPTPAATAVSGGDLFGNMNVKEEKPVEPAPTANGSAASEAQAIAQTAAATGSAFGFINGGSAAAQPVTEEAPKATAVTNPAPTKQSFDPLLSTPDQTPKPTVQQLSPAQVQAMYQQQMMMQQQFQMQQMQMAMAMQQQQMAAAGGMRMTQQPAVGGGMPPRSNVMQASNTGTQTTSSFSFLDIGNKPPQKEDHTFDFVKDALKDDLKK